MDLSTNGGKKIVLSGPQIWLF